MGRLRHSVAFPVIASICVALAAIAFFAPLVPLSAAQVGGVSALTYSAAVIWLITVLFGFYAYRWRALWLLVLAPVVLLWPALMLATTLRIIQS